MANLIENGRRIIDSVFHNRRNEASPDPNLISQEITPTTEEMRYYLDARNFWRSKEGKQIIKGKLIEGPSLARVNWLLPLIRQANIARKAISKERSLLLVPEIEYAGEFTSGLARSLYKYGIIPTNDPNRPAFEEWYSRYLPPDDMRIYEGTDFDGTPKSWDKFLEIHLSLHSAVSEFTRNHPETLKKR